MVAAALAVGSLPALSTAADGAVTVGTNITAYPNRDMVGALGYPLGEQMTIEVLRDGNVIAHTSGSAVDTPEGIGLEVNHGPEGAEPAPGECWVGVTPDLRGGDEIRVTTAAGVDTMTVTDLDFSGEPQLAEDGSVFVEGRAATPGGAQLPPTDFTVEFRRDKPDPRVRRGPFVPVYQDATSTTWRATFRPATDEERRIALDEASWLAVADTVTETTLAELGEKEGPAPGCEASPADPNAIGAGYQDPVNIDSGDVVLSGTAADDVTRVSLAIGSLAPRDAVVTTSAAGDKTWTLTVPKADLQTLPDGSISVQPVFYSGAEAPTEFRGTPRMIFMDTVAPAAPTASPPPGTYATNQMVTLTKPAGESRSAIRYVIGPATIADPDESSELYTGQVAVTASQTIKARVVDTAGNLGEVATFGYTIGTPPPVSGGGDTGGGGGTVTPPPAGGGTVPPPSGGGGGGEPVTPPVDGGTDPVTPPVDGGTDPVTPPVDGGTDPGSEPQTRTVVLKAVADTMARQHLPNRKAGSSPTLAVDKSAMPGTSSRVASYLRFNVPALAPGESIIGARLRLRVLNGTTNGPAIWRTGTRWTEQMTWMRRPARRDTAPVGNFAAMRAGRAVTAVNGLTSGGRISFELVAQSADGLGFASSERRSALRPTLILTILEE